MNKLIVPVICKGCRERSEPRPLGETPPGWERDAYGQGGYWCPVCVRSGR